jgi:hypothetical protein
LLRADEFGAAVSGLSGTVGGLPRYPWLVTSLTVVTMGEADDPGGLTTTKGADQGTGAASSSAGWLSPLQALASIGAGVIHAAAVGVHAEHPTLSRLFVVVAAAQLLVGLFTLLRGGRAVAAATALVNGGAVVAWIITRVWGISWIEGLEHSEAPQFADTVCAALGALAVGAAIVTLRGGTSRTVRATPMRLALPALGLGAVTVAAMMSGATHAHSEDAGHDHSHTEATDDHGATTTAHAHDAAGGHDQPTVAYDPTKPIDLSGVEGVTPEQQAFAENLVAITVVRLPQWTDPAVAEAAGFHSIGDGDSGFEHYVNWDWIDDDVWLDPDAPESLVYEPQPDGSKKLVSAMYMLPGDVALEDVPDYGGALMQWHVHDDLCMTNDPVAPQLEGLTRPDGTCRRPLVKLPEWAMIHVWIVPHECGPFASLEGIGAGTIEQGEQRWCDHVHGS